MIQPVKKLRILSLTVKGFKGFSEEMSFTFKDLNTIIGHNGQGKSSIADAIAFAVLILVLVVRPTGLFGEKVTDKV